MTLQGTNLKSLAILFGALFWFLPTAAFSQSNFYEGKTVTLLATESPGGTGDSRVKAMVPFLKKHIPGNPTVVIQYMDGAGGRKGANYLYSSARPDGLTIDRRKRRFYGSKTVGQCHVRQHAWITRSRAHRP